jgi:hypothetical protein
MPEISLLNPTVLNGVIEQLEYPDSFLGMQLIGPARPNPWPVAEWDVVASNKEIASPTIPNTEAKIVPRLGVGKRTASMVYLREKKIFKPTTLHWLRTPGQLAQKNAEGAVMREIEDLDRRFMAFAEYTVWQMLNGTLTLDYADVKATVDYLIDPSHKTTVSTPWATVATADVIGDVAAWKTLIQQDGAGATVRNAYLNSTTFDYVYLNAAIQAMFSDRMKDQYLSTGEVSGLLGLAWTVYDSTYVDSALATQKYIADDRVVLIADNPREPYFLMEGPSADHEAPAGQIGKFAKSWVEPDPSARQYLEEWHFLPILERPDQIVTADVS